MEESDAGRIRLLTPSALRIESVTSVRLRPVPQVEPRLAAEGRHGGETAEGVVPDSPALRLVEEAGEGVRHGVEIRGNAESPDDGVIPRIDDHRALLRRNDRGEPSEELGGSGAARQCHYHASHLFSSPRWGEVGG